MASNVYAVESGIRIPVVRAKYKSLQVALSSMQIGDSVFLDAGKMKRMYAVASRLPIKVHQQKLTENGVDGIRVWRVE